MGNGAQGSCTSKELSDAVAFGSGSIVFACGAAPYTIVITEFSGIDVAGGTQLTIDGGNKVSLSGGNANRVLYVELNAALTLTNISIVHGRF